jgi:RNA-binding protein
MIPGERNFMTSKQRAYLKGLASTLNPVFQVGKGSLTPELTAAIGEAFNKNELIKIAVLKNCDDDPAMIADMVAGRTHSQVVQVIGRRFVLYKPDKDKPRIQLPVKEERK